MTNLHPLADSPVITVMALELRTTPREQMYHDGDYGRPRQEFASACRAEYFKRAVADGAETQRVLTADMTADDMDGVAIAKIIGTWLKGLDTASDHNTSEGFIRRHFDELAKLGNWSTEKRQQAIDAAIDSLRSE